MITGEIGVVWRECVSGETDIKALQDMTWSTFWKISEILARNETNLLKQKRGMRRLKNDENSLDPFKHYYFMAQRHWKYLLGNNSIYRTWKQLIYERVWVQRAEDERLKMNGLRNLKGHKPEGSITFSMSKSVAFIWYMWENKGEQANQITIFINEYVIVLI